MNEFVKNPADSQIKEFYELVRLMREKQKMYFRYRSQSDLNASKELEKKVDEAIQMYLEKNLFNNNL